MLLTIPKKYDIMNKKMGGLFYEESMEASRNTSP